MVAAWTQGSTVCWNMYTCTHCTHSLLEYAELFCSVNITVLLQSVAPALMWAVAGERGANISTAETSLVTMILMPRMTGKMTRTARFSSQIRGLPRRKVLGSTGEKGWLMVIEMIVMVIVMIMIPDDVEGPLHGRLLVDVGPLGDPGLAAFAELGVEEEHDL